MSDSIHFKVQNAARAARNAAPILATAGTKIKNYALEICAEKLLQSQEIILNANRLDVQKAREKGLDDAMIDRLTLTEKTLQNMVLSLKNIVALKDPTGEIQSMRTMENGLKIGKMRMPLGVIGIIYESRPNVTLDAAALAIKSGNACVLRGGSEAFESNVALANVIAESLSAAGLPAGSVQLIKETDRAAVGAMLSLSGLIDVIIPRGGKSLVARVSEKARMPVIKHLDGICHVYLDENAETQMALDIALNAKTSRYGTCNTMETLLVHQARAAELLPLLEKAYGPHRVELRACEKSREFLSDQVKAADEIDWDTEYLAPILSIKTVTCIDEAIAHINRHGSHHTDSIVTQNLRAAQQFLQQVDSASVMLNASTRFADGFEYGLGAEIGISTDKFHVRGPVGLEGLTNQKWIVIGNGHVRT